MLVLLHRRPKKESNVACCARMNFPSRLSPDPRHHGVPHCVRLVTLMVTLVCFSLAGRAVAQAGINQDEGAKEDTGFCDDVIKPFKNYNCTEYMSMKLSSIHYPKFFLINYPKPCPDRFNRQVSTFDGFLLSLQLVQRNDWIGQSFAGDVLFWHSALLGGRSWFVADNPTPLAMADAGYSVWIAHARGTEYTFGHQMLTPNQKEFWNWDMDEWANYDFPAITDFVFYATKGRKFHFVGYSQGARVGIGAISYQWNRATMLASVSLIAPVIFMVNSISPVLVAYNYTRLAELGYKIGVGKLSFASITDSSTTSQKLTELKREGLCQFTGPNCCIDSDKVFRVMTGPYSLTTYKNLDHIAQSMKSQVFRAYDFGSPNANIGVYQNSEPPTYHLQQVPNTIPLFVVYGGHDRLSTPTDVDYFVSQLSTVPEVLFHPLYAHLDFIFSRSLGLDINLPLLTFIGKNSNYKE